MLISKFQQQLLRISKAIIFISIIVAITSVVDILDDISEGEPWLQLAAELVIFSSSIISMTMLGLFLRQLNGTSLVAIRHEMQTARSEANFWREENKHLIQSLAVTIKNQFIVWHMTPTECEIGFLLLKGFSLQEIADIRSTSERTVREQAGNIYKKASVAGRTELTAYFLEDLLTSID